jgi:hypothetical protein
LSCVKSFVGKFHKIKKGGFEMKKWTRIDEERRMTRLGIILVISGIVAGIFVGTIINPISILIIVGSIIIADANIFHIILPRR